MKSNDATLADYVAMVRRRWKLAAGAGGLIFVAFIIYAYTATAIYEAAATIQVERPLSPDAQVPTYPEQLLIPVTQRVLASENVTKVIREFELYPDRQNWPIEDLVLKFRSDTIVAPSIVDASAARARGISTTFAYNVTFRYEDAAKVAVVANELARLHSVENAALRTGSAARTSAFLQAEADKVSKSLADVQSRIAALQVRAGGVIASQEPMLAAQRYEQLDRELAQVDGSLRAARERKDVLQSDLIQTPRYRAILSDGQTVMRGEDRLILAQQELVALQARYSEDHPDILRLKREISALTGGKMDSSLVASQLRANIAGVEGQLAMARQTYSEDHPDVVRLQRNLESLQRELASVESRGPAGTPPPDNPDYLQLLTRIRTAEIEITELSSRRAALYGRLSQYSYDPAVEAKYAPLARERDMLQGQYEDLRARYTQATLSESVESEQQGMVLFLATPARAPKSPVEPNRLVISLLGFLLGLGAAFGSATLADMSDRTVRGSRDIESLLRQTPLAMIPYIDDPGDIVQRRRQRTYLALIVLTVIVVVFVVVGQA